MSVLTSAPYSLPINTLVVVQVQAINSIGPGPFSNVNTVGALTMTIPGTMAPPTRGTPTTESQITLNWIALTGANTGYSPILSYLVYWDNGSGTPNIQLTNSLVTTYTVIGLTGASYIFQVAAVNIYGQGPFSAPVTIVPSSVPQTMASVTTTLVGLTTIDVSFVAPPAMGAAIDVYQILLYDATTQFFVPDLTYCDGTQPAVITPLTCAFPIAYLMSNHGYQVGQLV